MCIYLFTYFHESYDVALSLHYLCTRDNHGVPWTLNAPTWLTKSSPLLWAAGASGVNSWDLWSLGIFPSLRRPLTFARRWIAGAWRRPAFCMGGGTVHLSGGFHWPSAHACILALPLTARRPLAPQRHDTAGACDELAKLAATAVHMCRRPHHYIEWRSCFSRYFYSWVYVWGVVSTIWSS